MYNFALYTSFGIIKQMEVENTPCKTVMITLVPINYNTNFGGFKLTLIVIGMILGFGHFQPLE